MNHIQASLPTLLTITDVKNGNSHTGTFKKTGTAVSDQDLDTLEETDECSAGKMFNRRKPRVLNGFSNTVASRVIVR